MNEIEINEKAVKRLKNKIVVQENKNIKTKEKTDPQMVSWIKKKIEEEVACYLNR